MTDDLGLYVKAVSSSDSPNVILDQMLYTNEPLFCGSISVKVSLDASLAGGFPTENRGPRFVGAHVVIKFTANEQGRRLPPLGWVRLLEYSQKLPNSDWRVVDPWFADSVGRNPDNDAPGEVFAPAVPVGFEGKRLFQIFLAAQGSLDTAARFNYTLRTMRLGQENARVIFEASGGVRGSGLSVATALGSALDTPQYEAFRRSARR